MWFKLHKSKYFKGIWKNPGKNPETGRNPEYPEKNPEPDEIPGKRYYHITFEK